MAEQNTKQAVNVANTPEKAVKPEGFMPMALGNQILEVPPKDGWQRRWFRGEPGRIARAQRAGWQFVKEEDVSLNSLDLGGDAKVSGNTDMGTHVSVVAGKGGDGRGQPLRMYLMECPEELYQLSRDIIADRNESIAVALRDGEVADGHMQGDTDTSNRYRENPYGPKKKDPGNLFTKKTPK